MLKKLMLVAALLPPLALIPAVPAGAAPDPVAGCSLADDRGPRCLSVAARLDRAPAVGQQATLSIDVTAQAAVAGARLEVTLPAALDFAGTPSGFTAARRSSALPGDGGSVRAATRVFDLGKDKKRTFALPVTAVGTGDLTVRVTASPPAALGIATSAPVLLTVGTDPAGSSLGMDSGTPTTRTVPADTKATPLTTLPAPQLGDQGLAVPHSDDPPPAVVRALAVSCVRGRFTYLDPAGVVRPSVNLQVQVWDDDTIGDDLLAVGLTDGSGDYRVCFDNSTDVSGGQDVYLHFVTQNGQWGVEWDDDPYEIDTDTRNNVGDGSTTDFGTRQPSDPRYNGALRAFDHANAASAWTPGDCWDARESNCRRIDINWRWDSTQGTFYRPGENEVYLVAQDADDRNVVVHELGHAVMDDAYEDAMPSTGSACQSHQLHVAINAQCAWVEGFGDWYGVAVFNDPVYVDTVDQDVHQSFDQPTWGSVRQDGANEPWQNGDTVEGRVAGALWDLVDGPGEPVWDRYGEGLGPVWDTFLDNRSTSFSQYWQQRGAARNGPDPLAALYQNTIDYGFRDPLSNHQSLQRPTPQPVAHNYRVDTVATNWSVVALRPPAAADYDLYVYDDAPQTQLVGASVGLAGVTDLVAIDSSARAPGDYYPQVRAVSGTGDYRIEADETDGVLTGTGKVAVGATRLATVWDFCPTAAGPVTLTVTGSDPSQDPELLVFGSDPASPTTAVRGRAEAAGSADANGPGGAETVTVTLTADCYGVVVVNKAGDGTYTLTQS